MHKGWQQIQYTTAYLATYTTASLGCFSFHLRVNVALEQLLHADYKCRQFTAGAYNRKWLV